MKKISILLLSILGLLLVACTKTEVINNAPVITGAINVVVSEHAEFDPLAGVTATDPEDGDLTSSIVVTGTVNTEVVGPHNLTYKVSDKEGLSATVNRVVTVTEGEVVYADGTYNFKFAPADIRHTFFAAAERYLIDTLAGGIPFFVTDGISMVADRVSLPVSSYIPSYGWGINDATLTKDDSQVLGVEGTAGEVGKYTYRDYTTIWYDTLNSWISDNSTSSAMADMIDGSFYRIVLNGARNGWDFAPNLASGEPVPVNPTVKNGKSVSKTWNIPLRTDLEWNFNSAIDTTGFDFKLDANDFIWTYREVLSKGYFRAISGGTDFISVIEGADAYYRIAKDITDWDNVSANDQKRLDDAWLQVGIKALDQYTIQFTGKNEKSSFDAKYGLYWTAINEDLYKRDPANYDTSVLTCASSGEYILDYVQEGKLVKFTKNPKYPHANETQWTGQSVILVDTVETAFQMFLDNKLEACSVPNNRIGEFSNDPRILRSPDASTWRLNVNGTKTVEEQQKTFPGSTYVPEPILGYVDFKRALYYSLDREECQKSFSPTFGVINVMYSSAYYVEPETGIPYRGTTQAQAVVDEFAGDTGGYSYDTAILYLKSAVTQAIAEGHYSKGTAASPTIINIDVHFINLTQSESMRSRSVFLKTYWERLVDEENHVQVKVNILNAVGSEIYDIMDSGSFDIAVGAMQGSALDAANFMEVYSSNSNWKMNYGVDTNIAEIEVEYYYENEYRKEYWSYDAITAALNGESEIKEGIVYIPEFDAGDYTSWEDVVAELKDFLKYDLPEFTGDLFTLVEDTSGLHGYWVILPDEIIKSDIIEAFRVVGFTYTVYPDADWCNELVSENGYVILASDLLDGSEVSEWIVSYFKVTVPVDADGNPLNAILFY
ncbi:MAG: ABC transporter substrate-binding protein [Acholeplasmatales bacterium]|jgi:ABC-type oligopeptide transport system substrate-binding subunit|nr:ABC transporter substrate-binding protein [Acholeplasmatales bacterium]